MKITKAGLVYAILCNIPVVFFLCLTSSISAQSTYADGVLTIALKSIDWLAFLMNYVFCFTLAMIISLFVPLTLIGRWFTGLFGIEHETYKGNIPYRLLATLSITVVYYLGITPAATALNCFIINSMDFRSAVLNFLFNLPIMLIVGFVSSLLSDITAYRAAHRIDSSF